MAPPLGSRRAFSTTEYFRMWQSEPYPDDFKSEIINKMMEEWTRRKPPRWFQKAKRLKGKRNLRHLRVPMPPTIDTEFVAKTRGLDTLQGIATVNEVQGPWAIQEYYKDHPDVYRHIPAPAAYALTSTEPSLRQNPGAFAMSYMRGLEDYSEKFPEHSRRWTKMQRRRFVRQMALMRLQLLEIRWGKIGGRLRHINPAIHSRPDHFHRDPEEFVKLLGPWKDARSWVKGSIMRGFDYWVNMRDSPEDPPESIKEREELCKAIQSLYGDLDGERIYRDDKEFCLTHNRLLPWDRSILMDGKKIGGLVDWEHNTYEPISESVSDLFAQYTDRGLANPDEWNDHPGQSPPFTESVLGGVRWEVLMGRMQENWDRRRSARLSYKMYGTITQDDFLYGDKYVDQPIPEDDPDTPSDDDDTDARGGDGDAPLENWWFGPVFHLMDDYLVNVKKYARTWKWQDPMVLEWAQTPIDLDSKCETGY